MIDILNVCRQWHHEHKFTIVTQHTHVVTRCENNRYLSRIPGNCSIYYFNETLQYIPRKSEVI